MKPVPRFPRWLGYAGLLPQFAFALAAWLGPSQWHAEARWFALCYAALIATFLGGTWWGLLASAPAAARRRTHEWGWIFAVAPSLLALALFMTLRLSEFPIEAALVTLGGALLLSPAVDARLKALAPPWWMTLRVPLSLGLGMATILVALA